jgi:cellulose synthase/poly-beta-1,6-N-acetylglucosamine synthase-like glycosyltransferase
VAWTEAPESFAALAKQRYRWAFGTLQCLWKHRRVIRTGQPAGLARSACPRRGCSRSSSPRSPR